MTLRWPSSSKCCVAMMPPRRSSVATESMPGSVPLPRDKPGHSGSLDPGLLGYGVHGDGARDGSHRTTDHTVPRSLDGALLSCPGPPAPRASYEVTAPDSKRTVSSAVSSLLASPNSVSETVAERPMLPGRHGVLDECASSAGLLDERPGAGTVWVECIVGEVVGAAEVWAADATLGHRSAAVAGICR